MVIKKRRQKTDMPLDLPTCIERVDNMRILGATVQDNLKFDLHVDNLLTDANRKLYAIGKLKAHGAQPAVLHEVFGAKILSCIAYASPAWWGYTSAENVSIIETFLKKKKSDFTLPVAHHLRKFASKQMRNFFTK